MVGWCAGQRRPEVEGPARSSGADLTTPIKYTYDNLIDKAFTKDQIFELKRRVAAFCNNNKAKKKKGEDGYDPAYKYDYIFDTIVHNVNALTLYAGLDLVGDEMSHAHQGHGETNTGLVVSSEQTIRGMQSVIVTDVDRFSRAPTSTDISVNKRRTWIELAKDHEAVGKNSWQFC
jgi:hypothetical protein